MFFFESLEILFGFGEILTDITATSPASVMKSQLVVVRNPGFLSLAAAASGGGCTTVSGLSDTLIFFASHLL